MNLTSEHPYWLLKNGLPAAYPSIDDDLKTEIAVIGGGITGALVAWHLTQAGYEVTVFDKRDIGTGSTSASTALLQYEIDTPLHELKDQVGSKRAENSYRGCYQAIDDLEALVRSEQFDVGFQRRPSLQYASTPKDVSRLEKEAAERNRIGIECRMATADELRDRFHIDVPGGLVSEQGAQVDPYRLVHAILSKGYPNLRVYDKTEIAAIRPDKKQVELETASGKKIQACRLVIAAGYESQRYIPVKIVALHATYAVISEPKPEEEIWYRNALIWETKTPYLYLRTTGDRRILVGGRDDTSGSPEKRNAVLKKKAAGLLDDFRRLMPEIGFKPDFEWAGTFGETTDSLPYIGCIPSLPNTFFVLGFGGNGITFSLLGAQIIRDRLQGKKNPYGATFEFDR